MKIYALTNGVLDDPWPKAVLGKSLVQKLVLQPSDSLQPCFDILHNDTTFDDAELPSTGMADEALMISSCC